MKRTMNALRRFARLEAFGPIVRVGFEKAEFHASRLKECLCHKELWSPGLQRPIWFDRDQLCQSDLDCGAGAVHTRKPREIHPASGQWHAGSCGGIDCVSLSVL